MKRTLDKRIAATTEEAEAARAKLIATATALRDRLTPAALARDAVDRVTDNARAALVGATVAARSRPMMLAVAATFFGVILSRRAARSTDKEATNAPGDR